MLTSLIRSESNMAIYECSGDGCIKYTREQANKILAVKVNNKTEGKEGKVKSNVVPFRKVKHSS